MSGDAVYILTPVGRFIMGDAFTGSDKDFSTGRPRVDKHGQPNTQWFIGLAIPKTDPMWPEFWAALGAVGMRDFPAGQYQLPTFAWKVIDGDAKYPGKPECVGQYIVRMSTGFAPKVVNSANQQIVDPAQCKRGDFVRAYISVKGNDDPNKPGIYVSHSMVQHCGYGEAIQSGPDAATVFAQPVALPAGASATPVAPALAPAPAAAVPLAVAPSVYAPAMPAAVAPPLAVAPAVPLVPAAQPLPVVAAPVPTQPVAPVPIPVAATASPSNLVQPHPAILQPPVYAPAMPVAVAPVVAAVAASPVTDGVLDGRCPTCPHPTDRPCPYSGTDDCIPF